MAKKVAPKSRERWPKAAIETELARIRAELAAFPVAQREERRARLQHALQGALKVTDETTERGAMRRYLQVMSALVHHERYGGLTAAQVRRVSQLALAILQVQRISPDSPRSSYLYADVHLVLSQILRRRGDHFTAAWEQQLARRLFRLNKARGEAFQATASAIRTLRLGHADAAAEQYARAEELATEALDRARARLGRVRSLRLAARLAESEALADASAAVLADLPAERRELEWEACCRSAHAGGDLSGMVRFIKADRHRSGAVFALEAWLWAHASATRRWRAKVPSASVLKRRKGLAHEHLYLCIAALDECQDAELPYERKLQGLGQALAGLHKVVSVEGELLVLAATLRWLRRVQAHELLELTTRRYERLCWGMSGGRTLDVLGIV